MDEILNIVESMIDEETEKIENVKMHRDRFRSDGMKDYESYYQGILDDSRHTKKQLEQLKSKIEEKGELKC